MGIQGTASRKNTNYYRLWEEKPGYIESWTEFVCDLTAPVLCADPWKWKYTSTHKSVNKINSQHGLAASKQKLETKYLAIECTKETWSSV